MLPPIYRPDGDRHGRITTLNCPRCGATVTDNSQFCSNCGNAIPPAQVAPTTVVTPGMPPSQSQTSGMAIASLVCGILNVFPLSVVAIVLGHISLSQIKKSAGRIQGKGLAIAGLVLGYLGIVAIPFILIIADVEIPNLLRAKIAANEASAVHSVRMVATADRAYAAQHQTEGFTCNLADLSSAGLSDSDLLRGQKHGYVFTLQNCTVDSAGTPATKFQVTAIPTSLNATGTKAFCADETGALRFDSHGSAQDCLDHGPPI
jgi:type IV pilus assembly protein PilA